MIARPSRRGEQEMEEGLGGYMCTGRSRRSPGCRPTAAAICRAAAARGAAAICRATAARRAAASRLSWDVGTCQYWPF